jgi:hypothetical protein
VVYIPTFAACKTRFPLLFAESQFQSQDSHFWWGLSLLSAQKNKSGLDCRGVVWYVWYYKDLSLCDVLRFTLLMVSWTNLCSEHWPKHFFGTEETSRSLLVGGFKHEFYFPFHIWDVILPIDELIFFRGGATTKQLMLYTFILSHVSLVEGSID